MKFLGEYSFNASADSYLIKYVTRFLRKPASMNKNIYNSRYDYEIFLILFYINRINFTN